MWNHEDDKYKLPKHVECCNLILINNLMRRCIRWFLYRFDTVTQNLPGVAEEVHCIPLSLSRVCNPEPEHEAGCLPLSTETQ